MRAVEVHEFGGPDVLELVEVPVPEPAEGQVLIRVDLAGINFADTGARENAYLAEQTLPLRPGLEVAGVVERAFEGFRGRSARPRADAEWRLRRIRARLQHRHLPAAEGRLWIDANGKLAAHAKTTCLIVPNDGRSDDDKSANGRR
jgi:hypothetical protein